MKSKSFPWIFSLLWLSILLVMIWAGFWQLGRAEEKKLIKERVSAGVYHRPKSILEWEQLKSFDAVGIEGKFASMHLLQDNQILDGQIGYFVYTAFKTRQGVWLWVNRGWTATKSDSYDLSDELVSIKGLVGEWPRPGIQLGEQNIANTVLQHVTYLPQESVYSALRQRLCQQEQDNECIMLSVVFKLDPEAKNGFVRKWQLPRMTAEKHQAYAAQWFTMSLVLCLVYIIFLRKHYVG
ncbi:MAG: SURF1 family protein [Xanthomonadales bacterium]|nr:SURF1 family protein [Xanthomonadales bacterium]